MNPISIITCVVGIVGCLIGVATFVSAQITKAKQDGMLIAKIDQCVKLVLIIFVFIIFPPIKFVSFFIII